MPPDPYVVCEDIRRANERFAQVGVRVVLDGVPEVKAPPVGGSSVTPADPDPNSKPKTGEDPTLIFNAQSLAVGRQARVSANPASDEPEITLVYCKEIRGLVFGVNGIACVPTALPTQKDLWNLIFLGPTKKSFTVPHELGHILTKKGHWGTNEPGYQSLAGLPASSLGHDLILNLMNLGGSRYDIPLETPADASPSGPPSKRLRKEQEKLILKHAQAQ